MEHIQKPLTGRRVLVYVLLFFGVVFVVNAVFIAKALQSNSGVVNENPYERGLSYNKVLEKHEREVALGWKGKGSVVGNTDLLYVLTDKQAKPVSGAQISVLMARPVQKGLDYPLTLTEQTPGHYSAKLKSPLKGAWAAHISVIRGTDVYDDVVSLEVQ